MVNQPRPCGARTNKKRRRVFGMRLPTRLRSLNIRSASPRSPEQVWTLPAHSTQSLAPILALKSAHRAPTTTRAPMLLFLLSGSFLLRLAERQLFGLLFHDPPRSTNACPDSAASERTTKRNHPPAHTDMLSSRKTMVSKKISAGALPLHPAKGARPSGLPLFFKNKKGKRAKRAKGKNPHRAPTTTRAPMLSRLLSGSCLRRLAERQWYGL